MPAPSAGVALVSVIVCGVAPIVGLATTTPGPATTTPARSRTGRIAAASLAITDMIQVSAKQDIRVLELGIRSVDYADHVSRELFCDHLECVVHVDRHFHVRRCKSR